MTVTVMSLVGIGTAVRVKVMSVPSVTAIPPDTLTTGVFIGAASSSLMVSVWTLVVPTV